MAMTMDVEGLDELGSMLEKLGAAAPGIAAASLYEGAAVMADAVNAGIETIKTAPFEYAANGKKRLPSPEEKALLTRAAGVAKFDKNGTEISTSVGISRSGYGMMVGRQKPVPQVANAINSGTSFMAAQPFFRKAVTHATGKSVAAIVAKAGKMIEEITKEG